MKNTNPQNIKLATVQESVCRPSFRKAFSRAAEQTEIHCCDSSVRDQMRELCYIIAEVYCIDPESRIKVADEILDAYLVQEVFGELTFAHLELVLNNFNRKTELVRNKRAYLRTALYNSVFELESHYQNCISHDLAGGKS